MNPIAVLIQDPPSQLNKSKSPVRNIGTLFPGYMVIGNEATASKSNDHMVLVNRARASIAKVHENNWEKNNKATSIGLSLEVATNNDRVERIAIFGVYIRPRASYEDTRKCLDWIKECARSNEGQSRTVILGDFNAYNPAWDSIDKAIDNKENSEMHYKRIKENRGRTVASFAHEMKLRCLNANHRERSTCGNSTIDLAFVGNKAIRRWNNLKVTRIKKLPTAHAMITLIGTTTTTANSSKGSHRAKTTMDIKMINSEMFLVFENKFNEISKDWWRKSRTQIIVILEMVSKLLIETLLTIQNLLNRRTRQQHRNRSKRGGGRTTIWNNKNLVLRRQIMQLERRIKTHKSASNRGGLKAKANKIKTKLLRNVTKSGAIHRAGLWERVKVNEEKREHTTSVHNATDNHCRIRTDSQINAIAREKFPTTTRVWKTRIEDEITNTNAEGIHISQQEVEQAIEELKGKKYNSPEGIKMNLFYVTAAKFTKEAICTITRMSFKTLHVPEVCWHTKGTIIPKKAPGQYRIVHVSNPIAALLEIVARHRLEHRLEQQALISPYQYGFTALRGRHDMVARIIELTTCNRDETDECDTKMVTIVALDIEGAFDNVDQDALIDKMNRELGPDSLRYWIAQFMLNRRISVHYQKLKSKERWVQRGVPQGSALGPILFNFVTHDIESELVKPTRCEILKYADDLIIVYKGNTNGSELQDTIDGLNKKLKDIKLNIKPEKCSFMRIKRKNTTHTTTTATTTGHKKRYTINGQPIKEENKMNILGVHITRTLTLDRSTTLQRVKAAAARLHNIKLMEIIHCAKEWRVLINSILYCHLVTNNWPILAIDKSGRNWTDTIMVRTLRAIFDWPSNTSSKLIRLILKTRDTHHQVKRIIMLGKTTEHRNSYIALEKLLQKSELNTSNNSDDIIHTPVSLEYHLSRHRRYYDPTKILPYQLNKIELNKTELTNNGPAWLVINRKQGSVAAEVLGDTVLQARAGRHTRYQTAYFNTVALMWQLAKDTSIMNRILVLNENDSTLQALKNASNKDWRIITLRETIIEKGWRILTFTSDNDTYDTKQSLANIYNSLSLTQRQHHHNFESWLMLMQQAATGKSPDQPGPHDHLDATRNMTTTSETEHDPPTSFGMTVRIDNLNEPYLGDYVARHKIKSADAAQEKSQHLSNLTTVCRLMGDNQIEMWQNIPPNWLNGPKLLMLSGMIRDTRTGQLVHVDDNYRATRCEICHNNTDNEHPTLHRAINCTGYENIREQLLKLLRNSYPDTGIVGALQNRMHCQTVLRLLAKSALNQPTNTIK